MQGGQLNHHHRVDQGEAVVEEVPQESDSQNAADVHYLITAEACPEACQRGAENAEMGSILKKVRKGIIDVVVAIHQSALNLDL